MDRSILIIHRKVTQAVKDDNGDISALCNPDATWWSPRSKNYAISDIESRSYRYYTLVNGKEIDVHVINDSKKGKYLRTDPNVTKKNLLDDLSES